ncbi:hypothetical protein AB5I41_18115 [Sphingomonas sp. MMS24-JH45]
MTDARTPSDDRTLQFSEREALLFHSEGRPGEDRDHGVEADGDAARSGARLFPRRRGAGEGDGRRYRRSPTITPPRAISSQSSRTAPRSSASATSARWHPSR